MFIRSMDRPVPESSAPMNTKEVPLEPAEEAKIKIGEQWFYRGNRSPSWFAMASRADGSMSGISEKVEGYVWPILEEVVRLRAAPSTKEVPVEQESVHPTSTHRAATQDREDVESGEKSGGRTNG